MIILVFFNDKLVHMYQINIVTKTKGFVQKRVCYMLFWMLDRGLRPELNFYTFQQMQIVKRKFDYFRRFRDPAEITNNQ